MDINSMKEAFRKEMIRQAEEFANEVWVAVSELDSRIERSDEWMRNKGVG